MAASRHKARLAAGGLSLIEIPATVLHPALDQPILDERSPDLVQERQRRHETVTDRLNLRLRRRVADGLGGVGNGSPGGPYAAGTSHTYPPACLLMWPVVTLRMR